MEEKAITEMMQEKLCYHMNIKFYRDGKVFGPGAAQLLRGVKRWGSLQKAAAAMGMAYSKAWRIVRELEKNWGFSLVKGAAGGRDGGGSRLTGRAEALLVEYEVFIEEAQAAVEQIFQRRFSKERVKELLTEKEPDGPGVKMPGGDAKPEDE